MKKRNVEKIENGSKKLGMREFSTSIGANFVHKMIQNAVKINSDSFHKIVKQTKVHFYWHRFYNQIEESKDFQL